MQNILPSTCLAVRIVEYKICHHSINSIEFDRSSFLSRLA